MVEVPVETLAVNETGPLEQLKEAGDGDRIVLGHEGEKAWLRGRFDNDVEGELVAGLVVPAPDLRGDVPNAITPLAPRPA